MATKSTRWTRADARSVVDELEASGLSIVAFCQQRALSYERVRKWRARLRQANATTPRLVELVARQPEFVSRPTTPIAGLTVRCPSGHSIELGDVELASGLHLVLAAIAEIGGC